MAMFSQTPRTSRPNEDRKRGEGSGLSIIGVGMTIIGDVETDGVVKVEGHVRGAVRASTQILLSPGGVVEGDLETREAILGGEVRGTVRADDRVEVQATSIIQGDIITSRIAIMEGGQVNGEIKMGAQGELKADNPAGLRAVGE
ncbi:MAG: polymer-forming cytoskeletal protein [Gemmatimonadota bacterium]